MMSNDKQYRQALDQTETNFADLQERGEAALGSRWEDVRRELYTSEEIAACDLKVALIGEMIKAREAGKISQRKLEELSGVRQPIISRIERQAASPNLDTLLKLLAPLGKTLAIVDFPGQDQPRA